MIWKADEDFIRANFAVPNCGHGPCGPVSHEVQKYLTEHGYPRAKVVVGRVQPGTARSTWHAENQNLADGACKGAGLTHTWVDVDGQIIDATASQFGAPDLLVLSKSDPEYAWYAYPPDDDDDEPGEAFSLFRADW